MKSREWSNVPAVVEVPVELVIRLRCSGYYDPGYRYDRDGHGCPPCGEDTREVESIELVTEDGATIGLSGIDTAAVEKLFAKQIENAELQEECDE